MLASLAQAGPRDLAFVALSLAVLYAARRWVLLYALLVLPGTLLHELAHWTLGWLLGARPGALRMVPVRAASGRGWTLASVGFRRVNGFNAVPVALAPLLLAPLALALFAAALGMPDASWLHWATLYAASAAAVSCLPSRTDWRLAASRPLGALLWLVFGAALVSAALWPG